MPLNGRCHSRLLGFDLAADSRDFDASAEPLDKSSKAESWHNLFSGAVVISRHSPGLNPVEGRRGFFLGGLSSTFCWSPDMPASARASVILDARPAGIR
jgi:hypothetical protein